MQKIRMSRKIQAPVLPSTILHRDTLVQALAAAIEDRHSDRLPPYKLVLLYAPAGYGKTTLLVDTASWLSSVCCWYNLDEADTDPLVFLQGLYASIQRCFPAFGVPLSSRLERDDLSMDGGDGWEEELRGLFDRLIEALKSEILQPFVLIFCNYHEVNQNWTINKLVDLLIAGLPQRGTIVVESQAMPNLTLAPLIAHRQMFAIGTQGLRFTSQEIYDLAYLQGITTFHLQEAEQLAHTFEGWITGILLGSSLGYSQFHRSASPRAENWGEQALAGDQMQLLAYITNEVFKHEVSTYEFLKKTSIFARLTPEHCNALLEIGDAAEQLTYAEQRGLFVIRDRENPNANRVGEYICHPALRQLFAEHLCQQAPEDYRTLHRRAAHLLLADHQYEQALEHACQAKEYSLAASIIIHEAAPSLLYEEQGDIILRWLEMLPKEIFKQYPQLFLITSNIYLRHGEFSLVPPLLDAAEALLDTLSSEQDRHTLPILQAELSIARGHLFFFQGEFQRTREFCQQALELLPSDERRLHIRAYQFLGVALIVGAGQVQEGITQLQHALQMSRSQKNEQQVATLHRLVANAYSWIGNHALAEYHQMRTFQIWEKLNNSQGIIYSLASLGLLKIRQGFTQQAEELLDRALHQARDIYHFKSGEAYVLVALGELHNNLGQYTGALTYLEDGLNLARHCEDRYLICCVLCNLAVAYLFMNDTQTAQFFLNQIIFKDGEKNSFERFLFSLTQGTVYLAQQNYSLAESILDYTVGAAKQAGVQIIHISALLRLAICYLRQNKKLAALQTGKRIINLNKKGDFASFLEIELYRYPELQPFLDEVVDFDQDVRAPQAIEQAHQRSEAELQVVQSQEEVFSVQILALGEPKVVFHGIPVTRWRMARAMELFFFLLESGRPMRKDQITTALWSEHDSDQIDTTVRTIIYYLRKALGKNSVIFQSGLYSLDLAAIGGDKVWYDVEVFNGYYRQAKRAQENKDEAAAMAAFTSMVSLYHGDYLQSFYSDWCAFRRDKLRQAYMDAHHQLAQIALQRENWEDSLQHWQNLLSVDACYETAHYGIMHCYLQQGKRELALRQFQSCRQVLQEELRAAPGPLLQKLYQSIIVS